MGVRTSHTLSVDIEHPKKRPPGPRSRPVWRRPAAGLAGSQRSHVVLGQQICRKSASEVPEKADPWGSHISVVATKPPGVIPGKLLTGRCFLGMLTAEPSQGVLGGAAAPGARWPPGTAGASTWSSLLDKSFWMLEKSCVLLGLDNGETNSCNILLREQDHPGGETSSPTVSPAPSTDNP